MTIETTYPNISIIIITHNWKELVNRLMDSVKVAADIYKVETELIIVNSSTEPLEINDDWAKEIYVPEVPKPYKKRNIGAKQSKFDWLLYLDDDCIVNEKILKTFAERISNAGDKVGGFYAVTEFFGETTYASRCCANSSFTYIFQAPAKQEELVWATAVSPIFRRKAYFEVNDFSEEFSSRVGGEDLDIGVKLNERGWILKGIPEVLSYHGYETWNSYRGNLVRFFRYGMAEPGIIKNHQKHTFLKLNALIFLVLPILADLILFYSNPINLVAKIFLCLFITTFFSAIYYTHSNKVPFYYAFGQVCYDRAFELGIIYSSIKSRIFKGLFLRFEYQKKRKLLGNNTGKLKIGLEVFSIILTLAL